MLVSSALESEGRSLILKVQKCQGLLITVQLGK